MESIGLAVVAVVEAGYRLIDSAYFYQNEIVVGEAISNVTSCGIVKRRQLFISSKTTGEDLPYLEIWKGMEDAKTLGLTKSIGVANFNSSNINRILSNCKIRPAINPTVANMGLVANCKSEDIQIMSYAPFGFAVPRPFNNKNLPPSFDDPKLVEIANKHDKSTSQVFLRYLIDRATIPTAKSTNNEHIRSNIDVFNFHLTREELYINSEFDINTRSIFKME